jgi:hypothetical protein
MGEPARGDAARGRAPARGSAGAWPVISRASWACSPMPESSSS